MQTGGRKIFMGDTGSLTLGYILSFLAVQYTMNTYEAGINYEGAILISFSVLLVPCLDVVKGGSKAVYVVAKTPLCRIRHIFIISFLPWDSHRVKR